MSGAKPHGICSASSLRTAVDSIGTFAPSCSVMMTLPRWNAASSWQLRFSQNRPQFTQSLEAPFFWDPDALWTDTRSGGMEASKQGQQRGLKRLVQRNSQRWGFLRLMAARPSYSARCFFHVHLNFLLCAIKSKVAYVCERIVGCPLAKVAADGGQTQWEPHPPLPSASDYYSGWGWSRSSFWCWQQPSWCYCTPSAHHVHACLYSGRIAPEAGPRCNPHCPDVDGWVRVERVARRLAFM